MKHHAGPGVDVYHVGILSDLLHCRGRIRHLGWRKALSRLRYDLRWSKLRRRNNWNGWLAEAGDLPHAGHGWTRKRAMRDLDRIAASLAWAQHTCGTVRLVATDRANYCVTCGTKTRRDWTPRPDAWDAEPAQS